MKKTRRFLLALCMILICGASSVFAADSKLSFDYTETDLTTYAKSLVEAITAYNKTDCEYVVNNSIGYQHDAFESYSKIVDKIGDYDSIDNISVKENVEDDTVDLTAILKFSEEDVEMKVSFQAIQGEVSPVSISFAEYSADNQSFAKKMEDAFANTVMGLGTVFIVLILISCLISLFKFIPIMQAKFEKKKENLSDTAMNNAIAQIESNEELADNLELVAVIAAAIATAEGTSTDSFVVRSIKKANKNKWQRA